MVFRGFCIGNITVILYWNIFINFFINNVPFGRKNCTGFLAFICPHLLFDSHVCFVFSIIIPLSCRKTLSWTMSNNSNNFVIKCGSLCIEWLSTFMNSSVPTGRCSHSGLTSCSWPSCLLILFFLSDAFKGLLIFIYFQRCPPMFNHMNVFLLQELNVVWKTVETNHQPLSRKSPWIS